MTDDTTTIEIDYIDVFDSMRALLADNVDLDDRAAVKRALIVPDDYRRDPETHERFINWCIKAARVNKNGDGLTPENWFNADLAVVLDYLAHDERKDYYERTPEERTGHIYEPIRRLLIALGMHDPEAEAYYADLGPIAD